MSDYIKREDALKPEIELLPDISGLKTNQYESFLVEQVIQIYKNYLKNLPAADVAERKTGKWIGGELGHCSCCGHEGCASDIWNNGKIMFCPNCGADMRGDSDV